MGPQEVGRVRKKVKSSIRQLWEAPARAWTRTAGCWISTALQINRITFFLLFQPPQNPQVEEHRPGEILVKSPLENGCLFNCAVSTAVERADTGEHNLVLGKNPPPSLPQFPLAGLWCFTVFEGN